MKFSLAGVLKKQNHHKWILFNFLVLAVAGSLLRYLPVFSISGINYKFLLHAHSHFAFSGWTFLGIAFLIQRQSGYANKSFQLLFISTLIVSFGMLISFFNTGYQTASIVLSTLFIFITYWFAYLILGSGMLSKHLNPLARTLIKGSVWYLILSSLGPFALGFLKASGTDDYMLQQNAIYFYLHFQMNGFMQLALLGLFAHHYVKPNTAIDRSTLNWAKTLVLSTLPLYALFLLWTNPPIWVYIVSLLSAAVHLSSWIMLIIKLKRNINPLSFFAKFTILAISFQFLFQVFVATPSIGKWVFSNRNLIIGYVHLITLGSLTPIILDLFKSAGLIQNIRSLDRIFALTVIAYLLLLFGSSALLVFRIQVPNLQMLLFVSNVIIAFVAFAFFYSIKVRQFERNQILRDTL